jgi:CDP-diacylglycerol--serine O-phosphatidyltransferase
LSLVWLALAVGLGALMTSKIRYYSFKDLPWAKKQPGILVLLVAILVAAIVKFSEWVLLIFACTYAIAGLTLHVVRFLRQRSSRLAAP